MPELAEVEFYRKQWDAGLKQKVRAVQIHQRVRVFRTADARLLKRALPGTTLLGSEAGGKQMLFRFSDKLWLGIHLGMSGKLRLEPAEFGAGKHDHLVIYLRQHVLVFSDPRQFGRIQFHQGSPPAWWTERGPEIVDRTFTAQRMQELLQRHRRLPIKAALLLQRSFPGIGNWMADEILWQAGLNPHTAAAEVQGDRLYALWRSAKSVCRISLRTIGRDFSDPPAQWLFHQRWSRKGMCPIHGERLCSETIGGRTTAWCPRCQPL